MNKIFKIWRFVIQVAWSSEGLWTNTTDKEKTTYIFSIQRISPPCDDNVYAIQFVVLKAYFAISFIV